MDSKLDETARSCIKGSLWLEQVHQLFAILSLNSLIR